MGRTRKRCRRRPGRLTVTVAAAGVAFVAGVAASPPRSAPATSPLKPMSRADLRAAQVLGTGCFWTSRASGPPLLAMVEDRAAIRTADGIAILSPSATAKDMFPFTYDRWVSTDGRIVVAVAQANEAKRTGSETLTSSNSVEVTLAGRRTTFRGTMQCGS